MNRKQMSETVDCWIDEQDLPPRPGLKPIRQFSCLEFDNEDEQQAYWGFCTLVYDTGLCIAFKLAKATAA